MSSYLWDLNSYLPEDKIPIYSYHVAPGTHPALEFHDHNVSEIVFVLSGEGEHVVLTSEKKQIRVPIHARDILVLHPGVIHVYDNIGNLEIFNLVYDIGKLSLQLLDGYELSLFHRLFPLQDSPDPASMAEPVANLSEEDLEQLMPMLKELQLLTTSTIRGGFITALTAFMRLVVTMGQMLSKKVSLTQKLRYQIGNAVFQMGRNFAKSMTLDELAKAVNMSRRNFCRQFRMMTGTSPMQYLKQLRLRHAVELLETTDLDVGSIALHCGFYDSNCFCKQFQKSYRKSPGEYRKERLVSKKWLTRKD